MEYKKLHIFYNLKQSFNYKMFYIHPLLDQYQYLFHHTSRTKNRLKNFSVIFLY